MTLSILNADTDESVVTVAATEQTIKSFPMFENYSKYIKVEALVNTSTTPASVAQPLTFRLKLGSMSTKTYILQSLSETDSEREEFKIIGEMRYRGNIELTVQGVVDDINTSIACEYMIIYIDS